MSIFGSSGRYNQARVNKIKKNLYFSQQNQILQSHQIENEFVFINLTRVELGDHRNLLDTVDLTLVHLQHVCWDKFTYLERSRNIMVSLTNIKPRLALI